MFYIVSKDIKIRNQFNQVAHMTQDANGKVTKGAKIRNQYNHAPHLTEAASGKVTNSQLDTTNEGQGVSPFRADDHKAHINRRAKGIANSLI